MNFSISTVSSVGPKAGLALKSDFDTAPVPEPDRFLESNPSPALDWKPFCRCNNDWSPKVSQRSPPPAAVGASGALSKGHCHGQNNLLTLSTQTCARAQLQRRPPARAARACVTRADGGNAAPDTLSAFAPTRARRIAKLSGNLNYITSERSVVSPAHNAPARTLVECPIFVIGRADYCTPTISLATAGAGYCNGRCDRDSVFAERSLWTYFNIKRVKFKFKSAGGNVHCCNYYNE
ncbi:hypothetical protein EVAR_5909_1 [Eumeta japonica]|uniref:Uncharacterized protein n=1 Tax=Eumeta variegata TaxID=151549 RepID=A0A4C1TES6_EUMVA|nr:hypothetical protein EVAR_5909_1 [Eumeta japonica]